LARMERAKLHNWSQLKSCATSRSVFIPTCVLSSFKHRCCSPRDFGHGLDRKAATLVKRDG